MVLSNNSYARKAKNILRMHFKLCLNLMPCIICSPLMSIIRCSLLRIHPENVEYLSKLMKMLNCYKFGFCSADAIIIIIPTYELVRFSGEPLEQGNYLYTIPVLKCENYIALFRNHLVCMINFRKFAAFTKNQGKKPFDYSCKQFTIQIETSNSKNFRNWEHT